MKCNIEKYRKYVDKYDLPETDKIEIIESVWTVMESFVDRAFGLNSTQQSIAAQHAKDAIEKPSMLELKAEQISEEFNNIHKTNNT